MVTSLGIVGVMQEFGMNLYHVIVSLDLAQVN